MFKPGWVIKSPWLVHLSGSYLSMCGCIWVSLVHILYAFISISSFSCRSIFFKLKKIKKFDPCSFLQVQNKLRLFRPHLDVFEVPTRTSFAIRAWPTLLGLAPNLSNPNLVPKHKTVHTKIRNSISLRKLLKLKRKLDSLELGIQQRVSIFSLSSPIRKAY